MGRYFESIGESFERSKEPKKKKKRSSYMESVDKYSKRATSRAEGFFR